MGFPSLYSSCETIRVKMKKIQATGGATKKKILLFLIIIGAVFGSIAPFVHIAFPKVNQ